MNQQDSDFFREDGEFAGINRMTADRSGGADLSGTPKPPKEKPEEPVGEPKGFSYELYSLLHDLVYILACVTIVFVFAVRLVGVDGESMYPTLNNADYLGLLSNVFYSEPQRGDIVVLTVPYFKNQPIVKRVIATGGQTVNIDFDKGEVYVDGVLQNEPYINEPTHLSYAEQGESLTYPVTVPKGCLFVMGDNRNHSADSRFAPVGVVDERDVLGKVLCILIPGRDETTQKRDFGRIGAVA